MKIFVLLALIFLFSAGVNAQEALTLEQSIDIAFKNNIKINIGEEKILQSEYLEKEAGTSFLPQLSSSFIYTRMQEAQEASFGPFPPLMPDPVSYKIADENIYSAVFTLAQPVFTGGMITSLYRQAKESRRFAAYDRDSIKQDVALEVKKSYFSILKARKLLENAVALKEMAEKHLKTAEAFFREGMVTKMDILKTEVFLSEAEQGIIRAENLLQTSEAGFNFVLNRPLDTPAAIAGISGPARDIQPFEYWTALASENHPDLKKAESGLKISRFNVDFERSGYYPQVSLLCNYMFDRGSQLAVDGWKDSWNLMLAAEFDIWNWGQTAYKVKRAGHLLKEAGEQKKLMEKSVELAVKNAWLNVESARKEIETAERTIEKAEENNRITDLLYKEGMSTTIDVLDAQTDLTSARNNYCQALCNYRIAVAELEKAAGAN